MNNIDKNIFNSYEMVEAALLNDLATEVHTKGKKARTLKGENFYLRFNGMTVAVTPEQYRIYKLIRNNYDAFRGGLKTMKNDYLRGFGETVLGDRVSDIIARKEKGLEICRKYFDALKAFIIEGAKKEEVEEVEENSESETDEKDVEEKTEETTDEKNETVVLNNDKRELSKEEIEAMPDYMPIKGYDGLYEVGKDGSVWSLNYRQTGQRKQLRPAPYDKYEHQEVVLYKDGKKKTLHVHQLVLNAYLPKPSPELEVLHKNSTASDNRLENLRWGPHIENMNDSHFKTLISEAFTNHKDLSTPVLCEETGVVYPSVHEAERQTGIHQPNISKCLNGKRKTAGGFHWRAG